MIWNQCISSRVVRITLPQNRPKMYGQGHRRLPVVSTVCREARVEALKSVTMVAVTADGAEKTVDCSILDPRTASIPTAKERAERPVDAVSIVDFAWFDIRRDTLWIGRLFCARPIDKHNLLDGALHRSLAQKLHPAELHVAALRPEAEHHWEALKAFRTPAPDLRRGSTIAAAAFVVKEYTVKATRADALRSGLFGLWDENRQSGVLVGVGDAGTLRALLDIHDDQHSVYAAATAWHIGELVEASGEVAQREILHAFLSVHGLDRVGDGTWYGEARRRQLEIEFTDDRHEDDRLRSRYRCAVVHHDFDLQHPEARAILDSIATVSPQILVQLDEIPERTASRHIRVRKTR